MQTGTPASSPTPPVLAAKGEPGTSVRPGVWLIWYIEIRPLVGLSTNRNSPWLSIAIGPPSSALGTGAPTSDSAAAELLVKLTTSEVVVAAPVAVTGTETYTLCEVCANAESALSSKIAQINRKHASLGCWMQKAQGRNNPRGRKEMRVRWAMDLPGPRRHTSSERISVRTLWPDAIE